MNAREILQDSIVKRVTKDYKFLPFCCGESADDAEINDFLLHDSIPHLNSLMAVTYVFEYKGKTIAYYSVSNDVISRELIDSASLDDLKIMKKIRRSIPNEKRGYKNYPAAKVGRLGVSQDFQRLGLGTLILNYIKISFIKKNKTGCRFITVDAYNRDNTIRFYERNGFKYLTSDASTVTRPMYFDLSAMVERMHIDID